MGKNNESEYLDEVFEILSSSERRQILLNLEENQHSTGKEIKEHLEQNLGPKSNLNVHLYHKHLPKLRQTGWIDYDDRADNIEDFDIIFDVNRDDEKDTMVLNYLEQVFDEDEEKLDTLFSSLKAPVSRGTLYWLNEEEGKSNLNLIATYLAAEQGDTEDYSPSEGEVDKMKVKMVHSHLPRLEDSGILTYDAYTEKISFTEEYAGEDNMLIQLLDEVYGSE